MKKIVKKTSKRMLIENLVIFGFLLTAIIFLGIVIRSMGIWV